MSVVSAPVASDTVQSMRLLIAGVNDELARDPPPDMDVVARLTRRLDGYNERLRAVQGNTVQFGQYSALALVASMQNLDVDDARATSERTLIREINTAVDRSPRGVAINSFFGTDTTNVIGNNMDLTTVRLRRGGRLPMSVDKLVEASSYTTKNRATRLITVISKANVASIKAAIKQRHCNLDPIAFVRYLLVPDTDGNIWIPQDIYHLWSAMTALDDAGGAVSKESAYDMVALFMKLEVNKWLSHD